MIDVSVEESIDSPHPHDLHREIVGAARLDSTNQNAGNAVEILDTNVSFSCGKQTFCDGKPTIPMWRGRSHGGRPWGGSFDAWQAVYGSVGVTGSAPGQAVGVYWWGIGPDGLDQ